MSKYEFIKLMELLGATEKQEDETIKNMNAECKYNYRGILIKFFTIQNTYYPYNLISYARIEKSRSTDIFKNIYELLYGLNSIFDDIDIDTIYQKFIKNAINDFLPFNYLKEIEGIEPEIISLINDFDKSCLLLDTNKINELNRNDISFNNSNLLSSFKVGNYDKYIKVEYNKIKTDIIFETKNYTFIHTELFNEKDSEFSHFYFNIINKVDEEESMSYDLKTKELAIGAMYRERKVPISNKNKRKYKDLIIMGIQLVNDFYNSNSLGKKL